jgi:nicotinamidase-related amidase
VVDMQTGVLSDLWDVEHVTRRLAGVIRRTRAHGVPVVFVQQSDPDGELTVGASGWQLVPGLDARSDDLFVQKTAVDSFFRTDLADVLGSLGVTCSAV